MPNTQSNKQVVNVRVNIAPSAVSASSAKLGTGKRPSRQNHYGSNKGGRHTLAMGRSAGGGPGSGRPAGGGGPMVLPHVLVPTVSLSQQQTPMNMSMSQQQQMPASQTPGGTAQQPMSQDSSRPAERPLGGSPQEQTPDGSESGDSTMWSSSLNTPRSNRSGMGGLEQPRGVNDPPDGIHGDDFPNDEDDGSSSDSSSAERPLSGSAQPPPSPRTTMRGNNAENIAQGQASRVELGGPVPQQPPPEDPMPQQPPPEDPRGGPIGDPMPPPQPPPEEPMPQQHPPEDPRGDPIGEPAQPHQWPPFDFSDVAQMFNRPRLPHTHAGRRRAAEHRDPAAGDVNKRARRGGDGAMPDPQFNRYDFSHIPGVFQRFSRAAHFSGNKRPMPEEPEVARRRRFGI